MGMHELFSTDDVHFQFFLWGFPLYPASAHFWLGLSLPRVYEHFLNLSARSYEIPVPRELLS